MGEGKRFLIFSGMSLEEIALYLKKHGSLTVEEEESLAADKRRGAKALLQRYRRSREAALLEEKRQAAMFSREQGLFDSGYSAVAGVDEAGRGPLAGPVFAAAVILDPARKWVGLKDSKQLSPSARQDLFVQIVMESRAYAIASATREEIDTLNIHCASLLAMKRAVKALPLTPDFLLIDGFALPDLPQEQQAVRGGDRLSLSIAAASVLAKVSRDKVMEDLHAHYPAYGFNRNKGYGTAQHFQALRLQGPCPEHRQTFNLLPRD